MVLIENKGGLISPFIILRLEVYCNLFGTLFFRNYLLKCYSKNTIFNRCPTDLDVLCQREGTNKVAVPDAPV